MRRLAIALTLLLTVVVGITPSWAATPTLVQHVCCSPNSQGIWTTTFTLGLIHPSTSGNFLMLHIYGNSDGTIITSVTDDQNQTWNQDIAVINGLNANAWQYSFKNTVPGVKTIAVSWSAAPSYVAYAVSEWYNVDQSSPIGDGKTTYSEGTDGGTSWSAGTFPTVPINTDLVYQTAESTIQPYSDGRSTVFSAATNFSLECADLQEGLVAQSWMVIGSQSSVTPTIAAGTSGTYLSLAVALTAASAGSDNPNSFRVKRASGQQFHGASGPDSNYQFPCDGNLEVVVGSLGTGGATTISSITSSSSSYSHIDYSPVSNGGAVAMMHADNFRCSRTNSGVVTFDATPANGAVLWFLDIIGAATSPLDTTLATTAGSGTVGSNTGEQSANSDNLTVFTFEPSSGTELAINYLDHNSGSETGVTGTVFNFVPPYDGQDGQAGGVWTMDSGLAIGFVSSRTPVTYIRSSTPADSWQTLGALFEAGAGGGVSSADSHRRSRRPTR